MLFGYSFLYFIPAGLASVLPLNFLKWIVFLAAFGGSTYLLDENLIL